MTVVTGHEGLENPYLRESSRDRAARQGPAVDWALAGANAMPRDIEKGLNAGFFLYLSKPIKVKEFMEALDVALEFAGKDAAKAG